MAVWVPKDDGHADLASHDSFLQGPPHLSGKRSAENMQTRIKVAKPSRNRDGRVRAGDPRALRPDLRRSSGKGQL